MALFLTTISFSPGEVYGAVLTWRVLADLDGIHAAWLNGILCLGRRRQVRESKVNFGILDNKKTMAY